MFSLFGLLLLSAQLQVEVRSQSLPLPNQLVRLVEVSDGEARPLSEATTNSKGRVQFSFKAQNEKAYVALTLIDQEPYYTAMFSGERIPKTSLLLQTYPTSTEKSALRISNISYAFLLTPDGRLDVEESFVLHNPTQTTIASQDEHAEVLRISLNRQVFNFKFGQGFSESETRFEGNDIILSKRIPPGSHYFAMTYEIDQPRFAADFSRKFSVPVESVEAFLSSDEMSISGLQFMEGGRKFYKEDFGRVFSATLKQPALQTDVKLTGLPANIPWTWWLPYTALFLFILTMFFIRGLKPPPPAMIEHQKQQLLLALIQLKKLRAKELLSSQEYENKKLIILEQLVPHYSQLHDRS